MSNPNNDFIKQIEKIICNSKDLKKNFIYDGYTFDYIYQLASGIEKSLSAVKKDDVVCLCAEDKGIFAAALIASLSDCPILIIPYSYSEQVLKELHESIGFTKAIIDKPRELPNGVEGIIPEPYQNNNKKIFRNPDSIFLQLFTGGSTGQPKIWSKTVRNLFSEALYQSQKYNISSNDLFISTVPPYHIYGLLFSVITPFISYASILDGIYTFPQEIASVIEKKSPTILISVPIHYKIFKNITIKKHALRLAVSSAGTLDKTDADLFHSKIGIGINEIYGSTETGGIATRCRANGEDHFKPFDNLTWKVSDERLYVTSEFISPELPRNEEGYFLTGDRVTCNNDTFTLLGRADGIIKVAGNRVNLIQVQTKLKQFDSVKDAYVISLPLDKGRENEIVALVEGNIDEIEIKQKISELVEPYAVPRRIKVVNKIPVTSTGKYDRKAIIKMFKNGVDN